MKMRLTGMALLLFGLVLAPAASAADKAEKGKDAKDTKAAPAAGLTQEQMMAEMMKYAAPGPMHEFLKPMAGSWKAVSKHWMVPGEPTVSEGTCENTWILGGRYLQTTYKGNFAGMSFEGFGLMGYDNLKKRYFSAWADNMGTGVVVSDGPADAAGKSILLNGTMDDPVTGKPVVYKMITKIDSENQHTMSMVCNRDGKDETQMEITYTRIK